MARTRKKTTRKKTTRKKVSPKIAAKKAKATRARNFVARTKKEPYENRVKMREFNRRKKDLQREIWD